MSLKLRGLECRVWGLGCGYAPDLEDTPDEYLRVENPGFGVRASGLRTAEGGVFGVQGFGVKGFGFRC